MKIVIDIDEEDYKEVKEDTYSGTPFENRVFSTIANGTPLDDEMMKSYCHGVENTAKEFRYEINKLLNDIKEEIKSLQEAELQVYGKGGSWNFVGKCLDIIDKHIGRK